MLEIVNGLKVNSLFSQDPLDLAALCSRWFFVNLNFFSNHVDPPQLKQKASVAYRSGNRSREAYCL
jgi:hypothetical protein